MSAAGHTAEAAFAGEACAAGQVGRAANLAGPSYKIRQLLPRRGLPLFAARRIGVKTVAKAAAKKSAKRVIHNWAGVDSASSGANLAGSGRSSRGGSAENLPAAAGTGAHLAPPPAAEGNKA